MSKELQLTANMIRAESELGVEGLSSAIARVSALTSGFASSIKSFLFTKYSDYGKIECKIAKDLELVPYSQLRHAIVYTIPGQSNSMRDMGVLLITGLAYIQTINDDLKKCETYFKSLLSSKEQLRSEMVNPVLPENSYTEIKALLGKAMQNNTNKSTAPFERVYSSYSDFLSTYNQYNQISEVLGKIDISKLQNKTNDVYKTVEKLMGVLKNNTPSAVVLNNLTNTVEELAYRLEFVGIIASVFATFAGTVKANETAIKEILDEI